MAAVLAPIPPPLVPEPATVLVVVLARALVVLFAFLFRVLNACTRIGAIPTDVIDSGPSTGFCPAISSCAQIMRRPGIGISLSLTHRIRRAASRSANLILIIFVVPALVVVLAL